MDKKFYDELYKMLRLRYGNGELVKTGKFYVYQGDDFNHRLKENLFDSSRQLGQDLLAEAETLGRTLKLKGSMADIKNVWHFGAVPFSESIADTVATMRALVREMK